MDSTTRNAADFSGADMLALTRDLCVFRTAVVADDSEALFARIGRDLRLELSRFASGDTFNGWQVPQNWRVRRAKLFRDGTSADLSLWKYPSDQEMFEFDLRGIFLGNYVYWEANEHIKLVCDRYGFEISDKPFDRTYRTMSNLDDMHENGVHDYLKFIKFGYGRATDHACKDIRAGLMSRGQTIELINRYDPVKPSDLARWLDYVGMTEQEFDRIADTFRDPRVWWMERGMWLRQKL